MHGDGCIKFRNSMDGMGEGEVSPRVRGRCCKSLIKCGFRSFSICRLTSACLCLLLFGCRSFCFFCLSGCFSVRMSGHASLSLFLCRSVSLPLCMYFWLFACLLLNLLVCPFGCLSVCLSHRSLSDRLFVCSVVRPSLHISVSVEPLGLTKACDALVFCIPTLRSVDYRRLLCDVHNVNILGHSIAGLCCQGGWYM